MRSPLCDLVEIRVPIIQAGMSIFTSPVLAAAVSDAGALGESLVRGTVQPTSSSVSSMSSVT